MPEMNGLELYHRLRERKYEVPVIFLTGHGDVDMAVQAMKDGAIDFIQKPINEERLLSAVAKAVRYDETHRGWTISEEEEKKMCIRDRFNRTFNKGAEGATSAVGYMTARWKRFIVISGS